MSRSVLVPSFVPLPVYARLRADARARGGTGRSAGRSLMVTALRHRAPAPAEPGPGRTSRAGASASTPLPRCTDMEQLPDERLDPAQRPALVPGEPVRQRALPEFLLQAGPLLRAQPLPRHRAPGPQCFRAAVPPGPSPPSHRPLGDPQVPGDLLDPVAASEPAGCLQPQPLAPPPLGGRVAAVLRLPHPPVIRQRLPDVTTCTLRVKPG